MCGIYGIISLAEHYQPSAELLKPMGDIIFHRGPDDFGEYINNGIAIGMRRLSIIDLEGGHQPISNNDNTIWLVCNGEIYNFRELRLKLKEKGHKFRTLSDCEVIIHLYAEYGDTFVNYLNGMYCFALWDGKRRRLTIGRDRLGIKPLYYLKDKSRLIFASEAKAILTVPGVSRQIDRVALESYLSLGYVAAPNSLFSDIYKLPVASVMIIENDETNIRQYWQPPSEINTHLTIEEWCVDVSKSIEESVRRQMVSDVPIGAFLSGGIDSSAVVGYMARHSSQPVKTYSIGFADDSVGAYYNELPYAKQVSNMFDTEHKEIIVRPDVVKLLPKLLWHMDEPIADAAFITTYLVAEFARQEVTVILSGVGGDELFGGYRRYLGEYFYEKYKRIPFWFRKHIMKKIAKRLPSDRHSRLLNLSRYVRAFILSGELSFSERYSSYVEVFNKEELEQILLEPLSDFHGALGMAFDKSDSDDFLNRLFQVDYRTQLPDDLLMLTDKMTMATSLECRVPLLDHELVELAARIPNNLKIHGRELKYVLKRCLGDLLPKNILYRKKRGFGAPMGAWLKKELAPMLKAILSKESIESRGLFRWKNINKIIALHEANKEDYTDHLLSLMNLELWCRMYLDKRSHIELYTELREIMQ